MIWGAPGARMGRGSRHLTASGGGKCPGMTTGPIRIPAGQGLIRAGLEKRPQQDSNLRSRLRRPLLSPLSYGGYATWERVPVFGHSPDTQR